MGIENFSKNQKGSVSIESFRQRFRLRWRYQGKRYTLSLFEDSKQNLLQAKKIAVSIENDLVSGEFDYSLEKYRVGNLLKQHTGGSITDWFEEWVRDYRNMDCDKHMNYYLVRNMIKRWGTIHPPTILKRLNSEAINERSYNRRLTMLKSFMQWLKKLKRIPENYLEDVQPKKTKKVVNSQRLPYSLEEITKVLDAIKNDTYSPKKSGHTHSHYYPFLYFIFKTGVRNAEAIGLRVGSVDLINNTIEIKEVLARSLTSGNAAQRTRKETKNGKSRKLPLTPDLKEILLPLMQNRNSDDLVFLSPFGLSIDDKMFQQRILTPVLKKLSIPKRDLYACRHTFHSRMIQEGLSPVMTAFLMGNNPETALRNYTHLIEMPKNLPSIE